MVEETDGLTIVECTLSPPYENPSITIYVGKYVSFQDIHKVLDFPEEPRKYFYSILGFRRKNGVVSITNTTANYNSIMSGILGLNDSISEVTGIPLNDKTKKGLVKILGLAD